jgi:hypothetical protein
MIFASRDELFEAILSVMMKILIENLHRAFDHWLERLDWVSQDVADQTGSLTFRPTSFRT